MKSPLSTLVALCFLTLPLRPSTANAIPCSDSVIWAFQKSIMNALPDSGPQSFQRTSFAFKVLSGPTGRAICEGQFQGSRNTYPASSIKALVAFALMRAVDAGDVNLETTVKITQSNAAQECKPKCAQYGPGKRIKIRTLLEDMITVSSNLATNQLVDIVSKDVVNQTADLLGASGLRFWRKVYVTVNPEPHITRRNEGNALDYIKLYEELAHPRLHLLSAESLATLRGVLSRQKYNNRFNRDIPQKQIPFLHKTGSTSDSSSDAGYFLLPDGRIVILAGLQDFKYYLSFAKIGKALIDLLY